MKFRRAVVFLAITTAYLAIAPPLHAETGFNFWANIMELFGGIWTPLISEPQTSVHMAPSLVQTPAPSTIPFADALSVQPSATSATIFVRKIDGTYISLQFGSAAPYSLLSPTSVVTEWLSGGLKNLLAARPGPSGVGLQSQTSAVSALDNDGSQVIAVAGGSSVTVTRSGGVPVSTLNYPIGGDVNSVFSADFNGDGNPDLAVAYDGDAAPGGIAILLNKGDGTFASPVTYAKGTKATRFVVFDLNHDGILDIALVSLDNKVTVVLGKGDGTFGSPVQYTAGGSGQAIAVADFNGDGNPDIAIGGTTGILLGNGDGTFRAGSPLAGGGSSTQIWAFAAGDLNGDGKIDLVYSDIQNQVVVPLFGNGDGTFKAGQAYAISQLPDSLILVDYNNDGRLDIVNGQGDARIFGPAGQSGNTDILLNNGDGTFQGAPTYFSLPNSEASDYGFSLLSGMAVAKFGGATPGLLTSGAGALTLFVGNAKGGLQAPQSVPLQGGAGAIAAGDFNGDGKADAAVVSGSASIAILLGTASGFASPAIIPFAFYPAAMVSGDFDGDGKADLAVVGSAGTFGSSSTPGTLAILKGNGDGTFGAAVNIPAGLSPLSIAAVDINGDGKLDLIFADSGTNGKGGAIYVLLNKGSGAFQAPVNVFSGVFPAFALADVNGDGKLDLIASNELVGSGQATASWLAGNGDGTFQAPVAITTSDATINAILVQDFNGDGNPDIVLAHQDGDTTFLAGYGAGTFSAEVHFPTVGQPTYLAAADLNGDGKPDLIVGGLTVSLLLNTSVPAAKATVVSAAPAISTAIAPGSLASAFGTDLATGVAGGAPLPLPAIFGGTSISIQDASGNVAAAPLLYVAPTQVNFEVPAGLATGDATVTVTSGDGTHSVASVQVAPVAPGLFALNSGGLTAAYLTLYHADSSQEVEQVYTVNSAGAVVPSPISLGTSTDQAYLTIFGTGFANAGTTGLKVSVGGIAVPVLYGGPQGGFAGLDQVNVQLPASLAGKGSVTIQVTANGIAANAVNVTIR
jgi:uncharacterized protein (TIGR03437 family)